MPIMSAGRRRSDSGPGTLVPWGRQAAPDRRRRTGGAGLSTTASS